MLKPRIGAAVLVKDGIVVQSIGFNRYLPVGKPPIALEFLSQWGVDEILLLDISATKRNRTIDADTVATASKKCFVPLAAGGGISTLQQVDDLVHHGADKVVLNHVLLHNETFITAVAHKYGDQCALACVDVIDVGSRYEVYDYVARASTGKDAGAWARHLESLGAGEIVISHVSRDGSYRGFDTQLINHVASHVNVPVIALGGAGSPEHFKQVFSETPVSAAYAGNYFHFTEHSVNTIKAYLKAAGMNIRLETHADYADATIDINNRILKKDDHVLEKMLYQKPVKEII